ncbi:hypothetical protein LOK49_LG15G00890 [Camellia lanceoleosa]|uniref:Uncharacterized protein n=1 Tax=Camellia lanceoleosa TaxID=1840588 RepID=A0ACC0F533_9ERIC|nr:hypothetical protein LOK49_LG15G00890 [Camellia lanceoleosa]
MSLGYRNSVGVDCNGSRGGLWAAWDDCQHITSVETIDRYLLLHVSDVHVKIPLPASKKGEVLLNLEAVS